MTFLNDNDMAENKAAEFFDNLFGPDRNRVHEARYRMKEQAAFFELVRTQKKIKVKMNPIEDFLWWMDISKECLEGYAQNNIGYNIVPNLKKLLVKYCRDTYIWQRINGKIRRKDLTSDDNKYKLVERMEGKIPLFNGFAHFNIFYFKSVLGGKADYVENGRRVYVDSFQWCEENQECSIMQHEAFPFIEIPSSENIYSELLNESRYDKLYNEAIKDPDFCNSPVVYERLKLIYASIMKIESAEPELNKWKSLLLAYIPDNIKIEPEREMVTKTVEETDTEEDEKSNNSDFIVEKLLIFHYLTGYSDDDLKYFSIRFGGINANSIGKPLGRTINFEYKKMSSKQLEQYKLSLEKVKNQLSSQKITEKIQNAIYKVDNDIIKCKKFIVQKKNEEEQAKKEKQKKKS